MELCNKYAEKQTCSMEKYLDGMNSCDASAGQMARKEKKYWIEDEFVNKINQFK